MYIVDVAQETKRNEATAKYVAWPSCAWLLLSRFPFPVRHPLCIGITFLVANPNVDGAAGHDNPAYYADINDSVSNGGGVTELNNWGGASADHVNTGRRCFRGGCIQAKYSEVQQNFTPETEGCCF